MQRTAEEMLEIYAREGRWEDAATLAERQQLPADRVHHMRWAAEQEITASAIQQSLAMMKVFAASFRDAFLAPKTAALVGCTGGLPGSGDGQHVWTAFAARLTASLRLQDRYWVVTECLQKAAGSADQQRLLLAYGLEETLQLYGQVVNPTPPPTFPAPYLCPSAGAKHLR